MIAALALHYAGVIDLTAFEAAITEQADQWWAPWVLVLAMVALYAFALPGSMLIVVGGVMYTPWVSTLLAVAGGLLGALAAAHLVRYMAAGAVQKFRNQPAYRIMEAHTGFFLLATLRILPGFPHSVINTSLGLLRVKKRSLVGSTVIGFTVKGYIYSSAVYHATHIDDSADVFSLRVIAPLIVLALFAAGGFVVQKGLLSRMVHDVKTRRNQDKERA
ncbi:MAG TPA: VTT domain-containing protein [Kiritimatiellia bacterium]|nr:VTT domain-containing protein [Kiritimatiellia bacterium]